MEEGESEKKRKQGTRKGTLASAAKAKTTNEEMMQTAAVCCLLFAFTSHL